MPGILDLPNEILSLICRDLPLPELLSTCLTSKRIHNISLPYLFFAFHKKSTPEHTRRELRWLLESIKNDPLLRPQVRSIVVDDMCGDLSIRMLRSLTVPLLSFTPGLRKLAIPGHYKLLSSLHTSIQRGQLSLKALQQLRCVECDPIIWKILGDLPQLCLLSLTNLRLDQSILELPAASLSVQVFFFEDCDLGSTGVCAVIKSCKRLTNFQYLCSSQRRLLLGDPGNSYLDVGDIHQCSVGYQRARSHDHRYHG